KLHVCGQPIVVELHYRRAPGSQLGLPHPTWSLPLSRRRSRYAVRLRTMRGLFLLGLDVGALWRPSRGCDRKRGRLCRVSSDPCALSAAREARRTNGVPMVGGYRWLRVVGGVGPVFFL